jgi:hypothetical protein
MDQRIKDAIKSFAHDCTIGSGRDPEECDEPDKDAIHALQRVLKVSNLTGEEFGYFCTHWRKCIQEMQQP